MKKKNVFLGFLLIGAVSMLVMSFHYLIQENSGILSGKAIKDSFWYKTVFRIHVSMGLIAILTGPFQFMGKLGLKNTRRHRRIGYIYSIAVLISSLGSLLIAPYAMGGWITHLGFSTLGILWFLSLILALQSILKGRIQAHKNWMYINYALTFSSITQRSILLFAFIPGIAFMPVYQLSSWLSWIINLTILSLFFIPEVKSYLRISISTFTVLTALVFLL